MVGRLSLLGIAVLYLNPAFAEITKLSNLGPSTTVCAEGYVIYIRIEVDGGSPIAFQMLNANGKPLQCKGKHHPNVIDPDKVVDWNDLPE